MSLGLGLCKLDFALNSAFEMFAGFSDFSVDWCFTVAFSFGFPINVFLIVILFFFKKLFLTSLCIGFILSLELY